MHYKVSDSEKKPLHMRYEHGMNQSLMTDTTFHITFLIRTNIITMIYKYKNKNSPIPRIIVSFLYFIGRSFNNSFLINYIKLLSNNIYPSSKLQKYIPLENLEALNMLSE